MNIAASAAVGLALVCVCGCLSGAELPAIAESGSQAKGDNAEQQDHVIMVTSPVRKDVISTQPYVCQIHSCQHIEVRALERGYLEQICVKGAGGQEGGANV